MSAAPPKEEPPGRTDAAGMILADVTTEGFIPFWGRSLRDGGAYKQVWVRLRERGRLLGTLAARGALEARGAAPVPTRPGHHRGGEAVLGAGCSRAAMAWDAAAKPSGEGQPVRQLAQGVTTEGLLQCTICVKEVAFPLPLCVDAEP